jgi:hypothetical protein
VTQLSMLAIAARAMQRSFPPGSIFHNSRCVSHKLEEMKLMSHPDRRTHALNLVNLLGNTGAWQGEVLDTGWLDFDPQVKQSEALFHPSHPR